MSRLTPRAPIRGPDHGHRSIRSALVTEARPSHGSRGRDSRQRSLRDAAMEPRGILHPGLSRLGRPRRSAVRALHAELPRVRGRVQREDRGLSRGTRYRNAGGTILGTGRARAGVAEALSLGARERADRCGRRHHPAPRHPAPFAARPGAAEPPRQHLAADTRAGRPLSALSHHRSDRARIRPARDLSELLPSRGSDGRGRPADRIARVGRDGKDQRDLRP